MSCLAETFCVKDGPFLISIKLTHLKLFKVGDKTALVLSQENLRQEVADAQQFKEFEKVCLFC